MIAARCNGDHPAEQSSVRKPSADPNKSVDQYKAHLCLSLDLGLHEGPIARLPYALQPLSRDDRKSHVSPYRPLPIHRDLLARLLLDQASHAERSTTSPCSSISRTTLVLTQRPPRLQSQDIRSISDLSNPQYIACRSMLDTSDTSCLPFPLRSSSTSSWSRIACILAGVGWLEMKGCAGSRSATSKEGLSLSASNRPIG